MAAKSAVFFLCYTLQSRETLINMQPRTKFKLKMKIEISFIFQIEIANETIRIRSSFLFKQLFTFIKIAFA